MKRDLFSESVVPPSMIQSQYDDLSFLLHTHTQDFYDGILIIVFAPYLLDSLSFIIKK